jgi:hypothetical protein
MAVPDHAVVLELRTSQQQPYLHPSLAALRCRAPEPAPGFAAARPWRPSVPAGGADVVPPGMRPPGAPDIPGAPGFLGGGGSPGVGGGGMHVGPDDPLFAGRMGVGRGRAGGLVPPGARWDPIGPPGMPARALRILLVGGTYWLSVSGL